MYSFHPGTNPLRKSQCSVICSKILKRAGVPLSPMSTVVGSNGREELDPVWAATEAARSATATGDLKNMLIDFLFFFGVKDDQATRFVYLGDYSEES
jgi:hypothetical protein